MGINGFMGAGGPPVGAVVIEGRCKFMISQGGILATESGGENVRTAAVYQLSLTNRY